MMIRTLILHLALIPCLMAEEVHHQIESGERFHLGGDLWSNPMEDWQSSDGWMINTHSGGNRNVVSLTSEITAGQGTFEISARVQRRSEELQGNGFVGMQIGLRGEQGDYRESAIYGAGLCLGVTAKGIPFIGNPVPGTPSIELAGEPFQLVLTGTPAGDFHDLELSFTSQTDDLLGKVSTKVHSSWVSGLTALTVSTVAPWPIQKEKPRPATAYGGIQFGNTPESKAMLKPLPTRKGGDFRFAFTDWKLSGPAVRYHPDRNFGPIWWATYTVDQTKTLRLLTQLAPIHNGLLDGLPKGPALEIGGKSYSSAIDPLSFTASFKISLSDVADDIPYTLHFKNTKQSGVIRATPTGVHPIIVASLSCNDSTGFPHQPLVENVQAHRPDLVTFHGDQLYEGIGGYGHIVDQEPNIRANICYLRKFAMHGWTWRDLLMTTPSITIPDDHDVMHGNIWGEGGKLAERTGENYDQQDSGGYKMSPEFVNMVHQTQTGNLPIPDGQPTCNNGISTYYTSFRYGPLDIAIVGDRQFKSAPKALLPDALINNGWPQNLEWNAKTDALVDGAQLLGPYQETFLQEWADSPTNTSPFRILVSQSPFLAPQTLPKDMHHDKGVPDLPVYKVGEYAPHDEPKADFDTNGWPQDKQKAALRILKKAGAIHLVGDQHLATTGRYGIDSYDDGTYWLATPAIANVWPRRWMPEVMPVNYQEGTPRWLGKFEDGFGNKFRLDAVANPYDVDRAPSRLFDRAVGYGISRYDLKSGDITLEAWPYTSGPQHEGLNAKPYPGWPVRVTK